MCRVMVVWVFLQHDALDTRSKRLQNRRVDHRVSQGSKGSVVDDLMNASFLSFLDNKLTSTRRIFQLIQV